MESIIILWCRMNLSRFISSFYSNFKSFIIIIVVIKKTKWGHQYLRRRKKYISKIIFD